MVLGMLTLHGNLHILERTSCFSLHCPSLFIISQISNPSHAVECTTESADKAAEYVRVSYLNLQPALARQLHNGRAVFICDSADKAHVLL